MERELTEVYCGNGKGKTALAIGQSIREAVQGKSVIVIQFLKGCEKRSLDFLEDLDNLDFKIFRLKRGTAVMNSSLRKRKRRRDPISSTD